jgi:hypothetical protein
MFQGMAERAMANIMQQYRYVSSERFFFGDFMPFASNHFYRFTHEMHGA